MVKPTTAELLKKIGDNKFRLVIATAKRARQISVGNEKLVDTDEEAPVTVAANEIGEGKVKIC
ncbi:MAG: DNA-directed RNA polymerase subunit omega [Clostridiaceae bacterium]|nr:DNA-directed RNA polymerase subunit omega [Clostridiaceae bacterium]